MCSRTEPRALALLLVLGALGCPESAAPPLVPLPPLTVAPAAPSPPAAPEDAGIPLPPEPPRVETLDAIVFEFAGQAEVRRAGTGEWVALAVGDAVRVSDEVRTSADGSLQMRFGEARIQVREGSELTLRILEARAVRAEVRGLASGQAADGGELTFEGSGAVAVVRGGQLSLDANGDRAVASSLSGDASLTSGGATIEVRPGQLATAQGASIPKRTAIPKRVALQVNWPTEAETNQPSLVLRGKASPSARVLVLGRRIEPAADGSFQTQVALKRGRQSIQVVAIDPLGRRKSEKRQITFDPNAPSVSGKVEYR